MALTKQTSLLFPASQQIVAGIQRSGPVFGSTIDCTGAYGGIAHIKITNGSPGPTTSCIIELQVSSDNVLWTFYDQLIGDTITGSSGGGGTASITLDKGVKYLRAIAYGNATNAVTVDGQITLVTSL